MIEHMNGRWPSTLNHKSLSTWLFPVEIRCRGFPAQSLWRTLGKLGIKAGDRKRDVGRLGQAAETASN